ncbi:MAG: hypothetical protein Q9227_002454 [Pyrenula ochraceoflavens]
MKLQNLALLGLGAMQSSTALAQVDIGECPAGYSISTSVITVTATPEPTPSTGAGECPAGYSMSISIITVTAAPEPTTTTYSTSYTTTTKTVLAGQENDAQTQVASATTAPVASPPAAGDRSDPSAAASSAATPPASSASAPSSSPASSGSGSTATPGTTLGAQNSGQATFYGGNVAGGKCSFSTYTLPSGIYGTALSDANWDDAANCGACVSVTGPSGNSITAMIVDECPGCGNNHLDLFSDAFAKLADPSTGVIDVNWSIVDCGVASPISLVNKSGTSQYWFSMQVVNANTPVQSLEVSTDGGSTWQPTTRADYNFFEISSGTGTDTVDVKVTGTDGQSVVVNGVSVTSGSPMAAASNLS